MKKILPFLVAALLAGAVSATASEPGPRSVPPTSSPELLTIIALACGAAVAGGLVRRRTR